MARSRKFRDLLLAVLEHPKDAAYGFALADWLQKQAHPRATVIRQSFAERVAILPGYKLGTGNNIPVEHIVVQLIPQRVAIEFACRCADAVLGSVDDAFPEDETAANVLNAIRAWIAGKASKRAVTEASEGLSELNEAAAGVDDLDLDNPDDVDERNMIGGALCVVQGIAHLVAAVQHPASSEKWWACVSGSLIEFGYGVEGKRKGWQRRLLIPLIREQELGQ